MSLISNVTYKEGLRTAAIHLKSGNRLITDAPTDNNGKGEAFSPTDLLSTSLASCMLTIMGIRAEKMNLNIDGAHAEIEKYMASNPRRVEKIVIRVNMPDGFYSETEKEILEKAALTCPVALSLSPQIEQDVSFSW